jgi:hypothetical protein
MYGVSLTMQNLIYANLLRKFCLANLIYLRKPNVCMTISMQENHELNIRVKTQCQRHSIVKSFFNGVVHDLETLKKMIMELPLYA